MRSLVKPGINRAYDLKKICNGKFVMHTAIVEILSVLFVSNIRPYMHSKKFVEGSQLFLVTYQAVHGF